MLSESSITERKSPNQALGGVKVLDFGWALVGSLTSKYLGDYGADVIKIESSTRIDLSRLVRNVSRSTPKDLNDKPWFVHLNTSKYGFTFNMKHPRARQVMDRLIRWADVINENFTPGTLDKLGYGYEYAREINPDIIMVSGSAYGQTGPFAHEWGIDGTGAAWSGYLHLTGWQDRDPVGPQMPYGDSVVPYFNILAVVAALDYRRRTGKGQHIDTAMIEVATHQITPALLDWQVNGHLQTRSGNRVAHAAPHGVFPCRGDEQWCAIAVFTQEEWSAFCRVLGDPDWASDPRFSTLQARKENEDALEELVANWTRQYEARTVMNLMQQANVPAGVVQTAQDLIERDPQMQERQFLPMLEHPVLGKMGHPTPPFKLTRTDAQVRTAPCLGEHVEYVCKQMLGMSETEFMELAQADLFK